MVLASATESPPTGLETRSNWRDARWLLLAALLAALAGCSKSGPTIYRVSGTITRGGEPMSDVAVHFVPQQGRPSWGKTNSQGRYELHYTGARLGAVAGPHRVFVELRTDAARPDAPKGQPALSPADQALVKRFGSLETTELSAHVERDGQQVDFALD